MKLSIPNLHIQQKSSVLIGSSLLVLFLNVQFYNCAEQSNLKGDTAELVDSSPYFKSQGVLGTGTGNEKFSERRKANKNIVSSINGTTSVAPYTPVNFLKKISKDLIVLALTNLYEIYSGNGNAVSKRSQNSTFALIGFVSFATFVIFALMPMLTLPKRQRIARGYARRRGAKKFKRNKRKKLRKPIWKYELPSTHSYSAVAVPGKFDSDPPPNFADVINDLDDFGHASNLNSVEGTTKGNIGRPYEPLFNTSSSNDTEYLTREEIMYLLKTL